MKKAILGFGIALFVFLFISGYASADELFQTHSGDGSAYMCIVAIKMDAAANAASFSLFETCNIMVYTTKACDTPINAEVSGNITRPTGIVDTLGFTQVDTGVYQSDYMFNTTGNYLLYVEAVNSSYWVEKEYGGRVWVKEWISVPFLSMYLSLPQGTRYQVGDQVRIWAHVEDSDGFPINDAEVNVTVFHPNLTAYVSKENMTFFANGDYYHTFTAPPVEGQYFAQVEARQGFSYQSKSKTFEVGGWATQIGEINETIQEVVVPYLQDINYTVHNMDEVIDNLNITASNLDYLIYDLVKKINETQGDYNVTVYNDTTVANCTPGSGLKQVIWRYDNETEPGVSWIRYRACANDTYNFTGTLDLSNVRILNYSCYNCSGGDILSVDSDSLNYSLTANYQKGWDIKVKLVRKTGIATFDGFINGTRYSSLSYLGDQPASSLPFSFYVATTRLAGTVMLSLEELKGDIDTITSDLETIQDQIDNIDIDVEVSSSGGGSRTSIINNYVSNSTEEAEEILESLRELLGDGSLSGSVNLDDIIEELERAKEEILRALEYYNQKRETESTGLASLFSGLETASTITMLLGLVFVILVVGVFLYIIWNGRDEEDSFSKIMMMKLLMKKGDKSSRMMAYSILSGKKSYMDKLFKFMITKDMLEEGEEDTSKVKSQIKSELKKDIIKRMKRRRK